MSKKIKYKQSTQRPFENSKYNSLFQELYTPLCLYCVKIVSDKMVAEDIVQEQFIYVWENWNRLSKIEFPAAYLYKAVRNKSITYLKKQNTEQARNNNLLDIIKVTNDPLPSEILEGKELNSIVEQAIGNLPLKCRTIFTMKRFAGMSNSEIAEELELSVKTVEAQMTIALKKLSIHIYSKWEVLASFLILFYTIF